MKILPAPALPARTARRIRARTRTKVRDTALLRQTVRLMVRIPIQKADLERTVPEFFKRIGWPMGPRINGCDSGPAFVAGVLACYVSGAIEQRIGIPDFMRAHRTWGALCLQYGDMPTTAQIVECMSPDEVGPKGHPSRLDSLIGIESKRETAVRAPSGTKTRGGYIQ